MRLNFLLSGATIGTATGQPCRLTNCASATASTALAHVAMAPSRSSGSPVVKTTVRSSLSMDARTGGHNGFRNEIGVASRRRDVAIRGAP